MMLDSNRYDKWDRNGRERDRERAAVARAQQSAVQQAAQQEPDANCLFRAPVRIQNSDRTSQQIQRQLGDYSVARMWIEHPGDSIGICAEPASPAPCVSRSSSEFKKPHHGSSVLNGRYQHHSNRSASIYNKQPSEGAGVSTSTHTRPAPLRIPNGIPQQNSIDSGPPIEAILKKMKLPEVLSAIAATPRKEPDSKFVFNEILNKVQKNPEWSSSTPVKPAPQPPVSSYTTGLDNRVSTTRESASPDILDKDLLPSESEDEPITGMAKLLSPLSTVSSSASESSQSESESESSSASGSAAQSAPIPAVPATKTSAPAAAPIAPLSTVDTWSLINFAAPQQQPPPQQPPTANQLAGVEAEGGRKAPSPRSSLSESSPGAPSPSSVSAARPSKRGRPRKEDSRARKIPRHETDRTRGPRPRGRPKKVPARSSSRSASCESDAEPRVQAPVSQDKKIDIFRKVFTPKKPEDGLGKGGAKGGKGGKGKAQVIVEASAPESGADDEHDRRLRDERRRTESPQRSRHNTTSESKSTTSDFESPRRPNVKLDSESPRKSPRIRPKIEIESPRRPRLDVESPRRPRLDVESPRRQRVEVESSRRPRLEVESPKRVKIDDENPRRPRLEVESPRRTKIEVERPRVEVESPRRTKIEVESPRRPRLGVESPRRTKIEIESPRRPRLDVESPRRIKIEAESPRRTKIEDSPRRSKPESPRRFGLLPTPVDSRTRISQTRVPGGDWHPRSETVAVASPPPAAEPRPAPRTSSHWRLPVRILLSRLRPETAARITGAPQPPIYFSYLTPAPPEPDMRDHLHYLDQAKNLRAKAETEAGPLARVILYLESVLCLVMTGRVLEQEYDTKKAFTMYRETIEYIKSIHSMPSRYRASPHSTFTKLDILSMRVQALLYLRMFKMYKGEMKEYDRLAQEYEHAAQSPDIDPSIGGGSGSSSGYGSSHSVPAPTHTALVHLAKYYRFLYVAHDLWEKADGCSRHKSNIELFLNVDRVVGQLTLFSTFRHLVAYVTYAISIIKTETNE